jgi:hypothetical protein
MAADLDKIRKVLDPVYHPNQPIRKKTRDTVLCCETSTGFGSSAIRLAAGLTSYSKGVDPVEVVETLLDKFDFKGKQNVLGKK